MPTTELAPIDFYFDIISPFGYFASLRIDALAEKYGRPVNWKPILIGIAVLKVMGSRPLLEIPLKGDYIVREAERYARRFGVKLKRQISQPPSNPLMVMRPLGWLADNAPQHARRFAQAAFDAYWREDRDITSAEEVRRISRAGEIGEELFRQAIDGGSDNLRRQVDNAVTRGVFGSPFFIVDGEPFFGVNSMEMLEAWLRDGAW